MTARWTILLAATGTALAACSEHSHDFSFAHGALRVHGSEVIITGDSGRDAHLAPGGSLTIGKDPVTLSPEQRAQAESYYNAALAIRGDALATGKAGAEVGATAAQEVVSGLVHGDTSQIGAKIEAKTREVRQQALGLCHDLESIRSAQESLAATLPAFKPYAVVRESEVTDCARDLKDNKSSG
jgi:hypothetical protein